MNNQDLIQKLKSIVIEQSKDPYFLHRDWFIEYHLNIVEKIALELCDVYKKADVGAVLTLVWIHDYGKILSMEHQHDLNYKSKDLLIQIGFPEEFSEKVFSYLEIMERKMEIDLHNAPIEIQIVSSADGASHMVGPFMSIYWKEYSGKSIPELIEANKKKMTKDWERKIVLPEVKKAFESRYKILQEQTGIIPDKFLF